MNGFGVEPWIQPAMIVVIFSAVGYVAPIVIFKLLTPMARRVDRERTELTHTIAAAIRTHVPFWFVLAGVDVALRIAPLSDLWLGRMDRLLMVLFVASLSFAVSRVSVIAIRQNAHRFGVGSTTLLENLARTIIFGMGLLLILANLGVAITPLLTALGVGSLAVALALQDTLSNLFSGIYIIMNRQIRAGDYIKLDSGAAGYVVDIGWRSTMIRERADNHVIIPNIKLAQAIVTNYSLPRHEFSVPVKVGVSYMSDLARVESISLAVARDVQKMTTGAVPDHEPFLRYERYADSSIEFVMMLRVREFEDQHLITHEFIKRLHERFKQDGIEIPFPQRVIHTPQK